MIGAGRVLADVFGAAELLKIQDLPSVDWSSMLTLAYPTTAMIRSMLKVWQVDLQPWSRPFRDYRRKGLLDSRNRWTLLENGGH